MRFIGNLPTNRQEWFDGGYLVFYEDTDFPRNRKSSVKNACHNPHAGGTNSKGKSKLSASVGLSGMGSNDNPAATSEGGDDDGGGSEGEGEGDPDSDRRKRPSPSSSNSATRKFQQFTPTSERILRMPDLRPKTGLARSTIYEAISKGDFPAPIKLTSGQAVGWRESDVDAWINSRVPTTSKS